MDDPTAARLPLAPARAGVGRTSVGMFAIVAVIWAFSLLPVGALGAAVGELALRRPLAGAAVAAVARVALGLPDDLLEAVLAHEVGHHRQLHPLATSLGWWYLLPFTVAELAWRGVGRATRALARAFAGLRERAGRIAGGRAVD